MKKNKVGQYGEWTEQIEQRVTFEQRPTCVKEALRQNKLDMQEEQPEGHFG